MDELLKAIGPSVPVVGLLLSIWWRIEGRNNKTSEKAEKVERELAAYKLHVAESYVTKSGMKELKDEILGAVSGIRDDVRHLGSRIDAMHDAASKPRPTRRVAD